MKKCFKCGSTEIVPGRISENNERMFSAAQFEPEGLRFLALTMRHGTLLDLESFACLKCGSVWSQTDPEDLRKFIKKHCNP